MIEFNIVTTKTGDDGSTSLYDGTRIKKYHPLMECLGDLDELNSWLGYIKSEFKEGGAQTFIEYIEQIQKTLFKISTEIATPTGSELYKRIEHPSEEDLESLEEVEEELLKYIKLDNTFILPGVNPHSSKIDIARTICRRAERKVVKLFFEENKKNLSLPMKYLNRLSDFLFIMGRHFEQGKTEKLIAKK